MERTRVERPSKPVAVTPRPRDRSPARRVPEEVSAEVYNYHVCRLGERATDPRRGGARRGSTTGRGRRRARAGGGSAVLADTFASCRPRAARGGRLPRGGGDGTAGSIRRENIASGGKKVFNIVDLPSDNSLEKEKSEIRNERLESAYLIPDPSLRSEIPRQCRGWISPGAFGRSIGRGAVDVPERCVCRDRRVPARAFRLPTTGQSSGIRWRAPRSSGSRLCA